MRVLLRDLARVFVGYGLATTVATAICIVAFIGLDGRLSFPEFSIRMAKELLAVFVGALSITASTAWPGYIVTLAVARWRDIDSVLYFSLCGVATAVLAMLIYGAFEGNVALATGFLTKTPVIYLGGLAGGFAYAVFHRWMRAFA